MPYTGRLGNLDARLANFKLGLGVSGAPPVEIRPWPDMMTTLGAGVHVTALTEFRRSSSLVAFRRPTTATLDD